MVGIYKITNKINNKSYIGQSINIEARWKQHIYTNSGSWIHMALTKYGVENFSFEILQECNVDELNSLECKYIQEYNTLYPNGYNRASGGNNFTSIETQYKKLSYDAVQQIYNLLQNSDKTQLEIAEIFGVSKDFITDINLGRAHFNANLVYPLRAKHSHICSECGAHISGAGSTGLCTACARKMYRVTDRPTAEVLLHEVATSSFVAVGKKYGVSDNAVRKWCKSYGLPTKSKEIKELYKTI